MPSVYEIVTNKIIEQLESGVAPWHKPWQIPPPVNLISQKPYRGINTFLLASQAMPSKYWLTFNQANNLGGHVKRGEHSSLVVFWKEGDEKIDAETGEPYTPFLLRYYSVFNLSQTEGVAHRLGLAEASEHPAVNIDACEQIVADMPHRPNIVADTRAYYRPSKDEVGIPPRQMFNSPEEYYATLFHELAHSTGHSSRLARPGIQDLNEFGSESYSKEELVAEMGAAMLCGCTGIAPAVLENSAAYLRSWIERLRGDSRLVIGAASQAQRAADFIRGITKASEGMQQA